ncbi:MAG: A/G-specific adenine glycosylase [Phycisphaerae bacterium]
MKPVTAIPPLVQQQVRRRLRCWFEHHQRPMPWRNSADPYRIWLSEVMLQQTQVSTVEAYYHRFLQKFPDIHTLAAAPLEEVLKLWAGLGYYRRAKNLHQAAQCIVSTYQGVFPSTYSDIRQLPGIGRYTAGAIASIAFGQRAAVLDGNVMRVLSRFLAISADIAKPRAQKRLWKIAAILVPRKDPGNFNQALMELGATVCTPINPRCAQCPLKKLCAACRRNLQHQLPVKSRRATAPRIEFSAVIIESPQGRLLARRAAGGLWEHLWEFPAWELPQPTAAAARRQLFALTGLRLPLNRCCGKVLHQLTHRRMEYTLFFSHAPSSAVVRFNAAAQSNYDALRWVSDMNSVPVARITAKIVSALAARKMENW